MRTAAILPSTLSSAWHPPTSSRWTETDAEAMFAALRASGLSVAAFIKRHGLSAQRYYYWRAKIAKSKTVESRKPANRDRALVREVRLVETPIARDDAPKGLHGGGAPIRVQVGVLSFEVHAASDVQALDHLLRIALRHAGELR